MLATQYGLVYWQANALQALSEHLIHKEQRSRLIDSNKLGISYINSDNMPDSLLAGNLAQRSLNIFQDYGDVYQTAGAYRSLSLCYWELGDYRSALICLEKALNDNKNIKQASWQASANTSVWSIRPWTTNTTATSTATYTSTCRR